MINNNRAGEAILGLSVPLLPSRRLCLIPIQTHPRPHREYEKCRAISDRAGFHPSREEKWCTNGSFGPAVVTAVCNFVVEPGDGVASVYLMMASPSVHVVSDLILYLLSRVSRVFDAIYQARGTMGNVSSQAINATYVHDVYLISLVVVWRCNLGALLM
jgi:hypothetical protein